VRDSRRFYLRHFDLRRLSNLALPLKKRIVFVVVADVVAVVVDGETLQRPER
jgi:hypothetical protein